MTTPEQERRVDYIAALAASPYWRRDVDEWARRLLAARAYEAEMEFMGLQSRETDK